MDSLLDDYEDTGEVGRPRREPLEPLYAGQAGVDREGPATEGVELLGGNGLLKQMTKAVLERAPAEELADHLVYDIGDTARAWIG